MKKIALGDVKNLVEYEKLRDAERARIIALKQNRRLSVGPNLTFLFENRETVLFQIQEMARTERIVHDDKIQEEIDSYNALIPDSGELSATLFIEIPDLHLMTQDQVRQAVNRFQGLDRDCVVLLVGEQRVAARFESGHGKEEKLAAVQYLRFAAAAEARGLLAQPNAPLRLVIEHPNYSAQQDVPPAVLAELLKDLEC